LYAVLLLTMSMKMKRRKLSSYRDMTLIIDPTPL